MSTVYLALGSNLGNRLQYIHKAVEALQEKSLKLIKLSKIIETTPFEAPGHQEKFLNAVLKAETHYSPEELIEITRAIENRLGRVRKKFRGPRVIDIDILLYDDIKLITPQLIIPHPRMLEREFVMKPLKEIDPLLCASFQP